MGGRLRGLLLPLLLIVAGLVALLINLDLLPSDTVFRLLALWPLALIVIGVEIVMQSGPAGRLRHGLGVFLLGVAVIGSVLFVALGPAPAGGDSTLDDSAAVGSTGSASLGIGIGAAEIHVHGEALGGTLYRVHAVYSGRRPVINFDRSSGALTIEESSGDLSLFGNNRRRIDLTLNDSVSWSIADSSGASRSTYDLSDVRLAGLNISGAAENVTATLPQPSGQIEVDISGGASNVTLNRPRGVLVGVSLSGGATSVDIDGHHLGGLGSDHHYRPAGFESADDRYQINVSGGASAVHIGTP